MINCFFLCKKINKILRIRERRKDDTKELVKKKKTKQKKKNKNKGKVFVVCLLQEKVLKIFFCLIWDMNICFGKRRAHPFGNNNGWEFLFYACVLSNFFPPKFPSCKKLLRMCKERGEIKGMNVDIVVRVDCFNMALIFLLFYFVFVSCTWCFIFFVSRH